MVCPVKHQTTGSVVFCPNFTEATFLLPLFVNVAARVIRLRALWHPDCGYAAIRGRKTVWVGHTNGDIFIKKIFSLKNCCWFFKIFFSAHCTQAEFQTLPSRSPTLEKMGHHFGHVASRHSMSSLPLLARNPSSQRGSVFTSDRLHFRPEK